MTMKMKCFALTATVVAIVLGTLSCDKIGGDDNQENPYKRLELTSQRGRYDSPHDRRGGRWASLHSLSRPD